MKRGFLLTYFMSSLAFIGFSQAKVYQAKDYPAANQVVDQIMKSPSWFMMIPEKRYLKVSDKTAQDEIVFDYVHEISQKSSDPEKNAVGLRLYFQNDSAQSRKELTKKLKKAGLLQDGDVMLTFHPDWGGAGGYPSIMTGISHSGIAYEDGDSVANLDMPLDNSTGFGANGDLSHLDNDHYVNHTHYIHIIRPQFTSEQRRNVREWARKIIQNRGHFYKKSLFFSGDYLNPSYLLHPDNFFLLLKDQVEVSNMKTSIQAYDLANMALKSELASSGYINVEKTMASMAQGGSPITQKALKIFCSDFVRSLHALRKCDPQQLNSSCVSDPYDVMKLIGETKSNGEYQTGLVDVNLLVMQALNIADQGLRHKMIDEIFAAKKSFGDIQISGGHRNAAKAIDDKVYEGVKAYLKAYTDAEAQQKGSAEKNPMVLALRKELNKPVNVKGGDSGMPANYSPTTFLIEALSNNNRYHYVATVALTKGGEYQKLSQSLHSSGAVSVPLASSSSTDQKLAQLKSQILAQSNIRPLAVRCIQYDHYSERGSAARQRWSECAPFTEYERAGGDVKEDFRELYL